MVMCLFYEIEHEVSIKDNSASEKDGRNVTSPQHAKKHNQQISLIRQLAMAHEQINLNNKTVPWTRVLHISRDHQQGWLKLKCS